MSTYPELVSAAQGMFLLQLLLFLLSAKSLLKASLFFSLFFLILQPPSPPPPTSQIASGLLIAAHSTLQMLLLRDFSKMNFVVSWQIIICLLAMENHSGSTFLDKTSTVQILIKYNGKAICE